MPRSRRSGIILLRMICERFESSQSSLPTHWIRIISPTGLGVPFTFPWWRRTRTLRWVQPAATSSYWCTNETVLGMRSVPNSSFTFLVRHSISLSAAVARTPPGMIHCPVIFWGSFRHTKNCVWSRLRSSSPTLSITSDIYIFSSSHRHATCMKILYQQ